MMLKQEKNNDHISRLKLILEIWSLILLVIYYFLKLIPFGSSSTGIVAITLFVSLSITLTVASYILVTYTNLFHWLCIYKMEPFVLP